MNFATFLVSYFGFIVIIKESYQKDWCKELENGIQVWRCRKNGGRYWGPL